MINEEDMNSTMADFSSVLKYGEVLAYLDTALRMTALVRIGIPDDSELQDNLQVADDNLYLIKRSLYLGAKNKIDRMLGIPEEVETEEKDGE